MNVHDSEKLAGILEREGYSKADAPEQADVILLNTCSIREKAAEKVFSELGRLRRLKLAKPDLVLGVCGCVAQQAGEAVFERAPYVDFVIGPRATGTLVEALRGIDMEVRSGEMLAIIGGLLFTVAAVGGFASLRLARQGQLGGLNNVVREDRSRQDAIPS